MDPDTFRTHNMIDLLFSSVHIFLNLGPGLPRLRKRCGDFKLTVKI